MRQSTALGQRITVGDYMSGPRDAASVNPPAPATMTSWLSSIAVDSFDMDAPIRTGQVARRFSTPDSLSLPSQAWEEVTATAPTATHQAPSRFSTVDTVIQFDAESFEEVRSAA